jgi:perosamine synthetase
MAVIPLFKPFISPKCYNAVANVLDSGCLTEGATSELFEFKFGKFIGNENTCLTNSCTSALHLAGILAGIESGDEVITSAMTCMATNEPFYNMGAKLVFADVEIDSGNLCPQSIESKITAKTKAIVVVHWAGNPAKLQEINNLAKKHGLKVIEDAAHALGSCHRGQKIGNHSDFVCFSFQAIKHLTAGDGGAICCKNKDDAERARKIRWFGLDRKYSTLRRWDQDILESGYKYHMNNINAAIGLENLKRIDPIIKAHYENARFYDYQIENNAVKKMVVNNGDYSANWIYSLLVEDRAAFIKHLKEADITVDRVHVRNDNYSVFKEFKTNLPNLKEFDSKLVNIPVGWWLSERERDHICATVNRL